MQTGQEQCRLNRAGHVPTKSLVILLPFRPSHDLDLSTSCRRVCIVKNCKILQRFRKWEPPGGASITDLCQAGRLPALYILHIGSNAWLHHIAAGLLWSAKMMTNHDENETRRNVDDGYVRITIIKYVMHYC